MKEEKCYVCNAYAVLQSGLCPTCWKRRVNSLQDRIHQLEVIKMAQDNTIRKLKNRIGLLTD